MAPSHQGKQAPILGALLVPQLFQSVLGPPGGLSTKPHQRPPSVSGPLPLAGPQEDTLC